MLKFYVFATQAWLSASDRIAELRQREDGQTMAEYAVVLAVITVLCVAAFTALSGAVQQAIRDVIPFL